MLLNIGLSCSIFKKFQLVLRAVADKKLLIKHHKLYALFLSLFVSICPIVLYLLATSQWEIWEFHSFVPHRSYLFWCVNCYCMKRGQSIFATVVCPEDNQLISRCVDIFYVTHIVLDPFWRKFAKSYEKINKKVLTMFIGTWCWNHKTFLVNWHC